MENWSLALRRDGRSGEVIVTKIPYSWVTRSFFVFIFSPSLFKAILKPAELLALWNVVSSTSVYQQFVPHFVLSIFTCIYLRLRISLIVACGIASERLALTARFEAVLDNEGKRLDASLSNSIRHSIFGYI